MSENISLCLIVKNEKENLRECLLPLVDLFSEIIVIDTGSTDRTREIALELGAKVFDFPWCDDFSAARNEMLKHATGDWIFWMDADDRLDAANLIKLKNVIYSLNDELAVYVCEVACLPQHEADGLTLISQPRLFRNHPEARWKGRVHEQVLPSLENLNYKRVWTDIRIHHVGYQDPVMRRRKANRDLRLLRLEYVVEPDNPVVLFNLGMTYMRLGQHQEAFTHLMRCLQKSPFGTGDWMRPLFRALATTLRAFNRIEESLAMLAQGLERYPDDPEMLLMRADLLCQVGDLATAERCLLQISKSQPSAYWMFGVKEGDARKESQRLLGNIYLDQNRHLDAERVFQEMLSEFPDYVPGWMSLAYVYLSRRRYHELEHVIRQIEKCPSGDIFSLVMKTEYLIAREEFTSAKASIEEAIARAPQFIWARVVLGKLLERQGTDREGFIAVQRDILRLDPGNVVAKQVLASLENPVRVNTPSLSPSPLSWTITVTE